MTSFAFIFGVMPLVVASGAGAEMRRSLGTAVFSGMLGVTMFGIFLTPVFFYVIQGLSESRLFMSERTRAIGSYLTGGVSGRLTRLLAGPDRHRALSLPQDRSRQLGRWWLVGWAVLAGVLIIRGDSVESRERIKRRFGSTGYDRLGDEQHVIARFFVDRPIFATVISLVIMLAGGVAVFTLPVAQYPDVTPPTVQVTAFYPGANATTVRDTVAAPIEEQVSGVEGMMYMSSRCTNDGSLQPDGDLQARHGLGHGPGAGAKPRLAGAAGHPAAGAERRHQRQEDVAEHADDRQSDLARRPLRRPFLSNYATIDVRDELGRLPGVAGITYLGQRDYSLRAWLDPDKLAALNLERHGRGHGHRPAEHSGRRRADRPAAGPDGPAIPVDRSTPWAGSTDPEQFADIIIKSRPRHDAGSTPPRHRRHRAGSSTGSSDVHSQRRLHAAALSAAATSHRHRPTRRDVARRRTRRRSSTTSPARSTASRRWPCRSISCPAPTPWRPPTASTPR